MNTIAIDCGASFIKAALFDTSGKKLRHIQRTAPAAGGEKKQIDVLISLVRSMIEELTAGQAEVALGISNEMHGFLLAYEDGRPFTDYISWQKEYGAIPVDGISARQILSNIYIYIYTGMPVRAGLPSCNLLYLNRSGALKGAKSRLRFYTLGDYILRRLSGEDPGVHPTNAAATGLYDLRTKDWSREMIRFAGGEEVDFLPVCEKRVAFQIKGTKVYAWPAIGDQQAALLGAGLCKAGELSFNMGTGAQVSVLTSKLEKPDGFQVRPFFNDAYLKTIPHIPSGRALNVYLRFFRDVLAQFGMNLSDESVWRRLLELEQCASETEMICDLSFFENAVSSHTRGGLSNIGEYDLTAANLMRTVFRQTAQNFIRCADCIAPRPEEVQCIIFSGGIARRISSIREQITAHYPEATLATIAEDETLKGLYIYVSGDTNQNN